MQLQKSLPIIRLFNQQAKSENSALPYAFIQLNYHRKLEK